MSQTLQSVLDALYAASEDGGLWVASPDHCWTDAAGTVAAGDNDLVVRIDDLSGNARHAIQETADNQLRLKQAGDGRWYLDPETRSVRYAITQFNIAQNYTVAGAYVVDTVSANATVLFGRSAVNGDTSYIAANFTDTPSRMTIRANGGTDQGVFASTSANSEINDGDVIATGFSTDRTTWSNSLPRLYNSRTTNYFTLSLGTNSGTPDVNFNVSVFGSASSTYSKKPIYGAALREGTTAQADMDLLLAFLTDPTLLTTRTGVTITGIKEPNESDTLVTGVSNARAVVWTGDPPSDASTANEVLTSQSITDGAMELEFTHTPGELATALIAVDWDAGGGETKYFRAEATIVDLDA